MVTIRFFPVFLETDREQKLNILKTHPTSNDPVAAPLFCSSRHTTYSMVLLFSSLRFASLLNLGHCTRTITMASFSSSATGSGNKVRSALDETSATGEFVRVASSFREKISPDHPVFKPEAGRYHLYISLAW